MNKGQGQGQEKINKKDQLNKKPPKPKSASKDKDKEKDKKEKEMTKEQKDKEGKDTKKGQKETQEGGCDGDDKSQQGMNTNAQIQKLKTELDEEKKKNRQLSTQIMTDDKLSQKMKQTIDQMKQQITDLNTEKTKADAKIRRLEEENTDLRVRIIQNKHRSQSGGNQAEIQMQNRIQELESQNKHLLDKIHMVSMGERRTEQSRGEEDDEDRKMQVVMIADSNRKEICRHIDKTAVDWEMNEDIYTIEMLEQHLNDQQLNHYKEKDIIVVMEGTNDIRKEKDGIATAKRYINLLDKITKVSLGWTTVMAVKIPPLGKKYKQTIQAERLIFNKFIEESGHICIDIEENLAELKEGDILKEQV